MTLISDGILEMMQKIKADWDPNNDLLLIVKKAKAKSESSYTVWPDCDRHPNSS